MKLFSFFSALFFSAFLFTGTLLAQDNDYWMVVPANYAGAPYNIPLLSVFAENSTIVTVKAAAATFTMTADQNGQTWPNTMPLIPQHKIVGKRAIHAYTADGAPFRALIAINPEEWGEGVQCLPTNTLGRMYRIIGYKNSGGNTHPGNGTAPEFAIVATKDSTEVTIDFPPGKGLAPITITMNAGSTYHVDCGKPDVKIDPTGTRVTATQPIAVFSGQATSYISGVAYGNALMEEMIPIESWGKLHMVVSDPLQPGDIFRFVADCDGTEISNDGAVIATIDAGKFYETKLIGAHEICSSKPIMVAKFTVGGNTLYGGEQGGPSMLVIPPVSCYFDSSRFYQLDIPPAQGGTGVPGAVIICPTANIASVLFDGTPVAGFAPILNFCSPIQYSYAYVPIAVTTAGSHTLWYSTPPAGNPYSLYGYYTSQDGDRDENLAWNIGYRGIIPRVPRASLSPSKFYFDTLVCDTTKSIPFKLSNSGEAPLTVSSLSGLAAPFTINGVTIPVTLQPGDFVNGTVTFTSSTPGTYMQTLLLGTNETGICGPPVDTFHVEAHKERAAIVRTPAQVDFGEVRCRDYDTVVTITNVGTVNVRIDSTQFSQTGMIVLSPTLPVTILPQQSRQLTVRLSTSSIPEGPYSSNLHTVSEPCTLAADFVFSATKISLKYSISPDSVNFGVTKVNKTSADSLRFFNKSTSTVRLNSAKFDDPSFPGTVTGPSFPQYLPPGGSLTVYFTATPRDTIPHRSNLTVKSDSECISGRFIPVSVEGAITCPQAEVTEVLGKVPGDKVIIPIMMEPSSKFATTTTIDLVVKYDLKLLQQADIPSSPVGTVSKVQSLPDGVSFTITTPGSLPPGTRTIADLHLEALLAPKLTGEFTVSTSTFTLRSNEQISGSPKCTTPFSLGSECIKPDMLQDRSGAVIEGIYPNPTEAGATIAINAFGTPHVRIDVFDTFGRKVETVADALFTSGKHDITLDVARYANGIYFCRMITGSGTITREFNVRK